jgi:hypothetical protein
MSPLGGDAIKQSKLRASLALYEDRVKTADFDMHKAKGLKSIQVAR